MRKAIHKIIASFLFLTSFMYAGCSLFNLDTKAGDYVISGKVVDKEGNAITGVTLFVSGSSDITAETDEEGNYVLSKVSGTTLSVIARKAGFLMIPDFGFTDGYVSGSYINVSASAHNGVVENANFIAVRDDQVKISDVQGEKSKSTLEGKEVTVTGVVTMITNQSPHFKYNNIDISGDGVPQYTGTDGFFIEALPEDKDFSGKKSNGLYISTHDSAFSESKWKEGIPTDLQAGDVVTVKGIVIEERVINHYGHCENSLTRTAIDADAVFKVYENGVAKTAGFPEGVLLTYDEAKGQAWANQVYTVDGVNYQREYRVLPFDSNSASPMVDAINVFESVESMVIRINDPVVCGATYYNMTPVLADDAKGPDGNYFRTYNAKWKGNVIQENEKNHRHDYNEEVIMIDYQAVDWTTSYPLTQMGDKVVDSTGAKVFRGVMDYQPFGNSFMYFAHPLNNEKSDYVQNTVVDNYLTPYYTRTDSKKIYGVSGNEIPNQGFNFDVTESWVYKYLNESGNVNAANIISAMNSNGNSKVTGDSGCSSKNIKKNVLPFRTGTEGSTFDADPIFTPLWKDKSSTDKGNIEEKSLTVAAYNLENYEAQGSSNDKQANVALVIKNNLLYPDVLCIVEMGDDVATTVIYANADNQYAIKDGHITAVRNLSELSDAIVAMEGPRYDFRCIDPKDGDSGGKGGVNIRVALFYNTERVEAVDAGLPTNTYLNTHGGSYGGTLAPMEEWPVQTEYDNPQGWVLSDASGTAYVGSDGKAHLTQSPTYVQSSYFSGSRRPLLCEFKLKGTDENFFVMACHLGSKRGDHSLYGEIQPPVLLSEVKRNGQAAAVNATVQSILECDKDAKVVVAGDMNDFAFSTPQRVLTGQRGGNQILYSPVEEFAPIKEQFSYYFEGNLQQIDHVFVTKSLFEKARAAVAANEYSCGENEEWKNVCFISHINSTVNRLNHINLSDHDPDMIRIPNAFEGAE